MKIILRQSLDAVSTQELIRRLDFANAESREEIAQALNDRDFVLTKDFNYYYTQVFLEPDKDSDRLTNVKHFVTFANSKDDALQKAKKYISEKWTNELESIYLYHKNYIRESRVLVKNGHFC